MQNETTPHSSPNASVLMTLRLEGLAIAAFGLAGYQVAEGSWVLFAMLFLVPDITMVGYFFGNRWGAITYNLGHSYCGPVFLALVGWVSAMPMVAHLALIWVVHIGFDRAIGYGLKFPTGFKETHLSRR